MSPNSLTNPTAMTLGELLACAREMHAGTMSLTGKGEGGKPLYLALVAIGEEAERLAPLVERLTGVPKREPRRTRPKR